MISIVIRNKNEVTALESTLSILTSVYKGDFAEIIVVDNNSTDDSVEVALKYHCKVVTIENFSYGRAINVGIEKSSSKYILLLSSHAIPIGASFFKNTFAALQKSENIAGIRYINSVANYQSAIKNGFKVVDPIGAGLLAACCVVNKSVWQTHRFDEGLIAVEDKEWSARVLKAGFEILDLNETFFYFLRRDYKRSLNKYKIETIAAYQLNNRKFATRTKIFGSFLKKVVYLNTITYFQNIQRACYSLKINMEIHKAIKNVRKHK